jgi:hypothetical protein
MRLVAKLLVHLASEQLQLRYMVNGTKDYYLTANQLLNDGHYAVNLVSEGNAVTRSFSDEAKNRILALAPLLEAVPDLPPFALVHHPSWIALRRQAQHCLRALDVDLAAWEANQ